MVTETSKCEFYNKEILFLGHNFTASGIKPDNVKVESITMMLPPTDAGTVRTFNA